MKSIPDAHLTSRPTKGLLSATAKSAHAPLPWGVVEHSWRETSIVGSDGESVCFTDIGEEHPDDDSTAAEAVARANAALIVRAVNNQDALLTVALMFTETIERVEDRCMAADGPVTPTCDEITDAELRAIYVAACAAIAASEAVAGSAIPNEGSQTAHLMAPVGSDLQTADAEGEGPCCDDDGCPTELAVLQRFWRGQPVPPEREPLWFKAIPKINQPSQE